MLKRRRRKTTTIGGMVGGCRWEMVCGLGVEDCLMMMATHNEERPRFN